MPQQKKKRGGVRIAWRWAGMLLAIVGLLALSIQPAHGLAYSFAVTRSTADLYVNADGTVTIDYDYVFQNNPGAEAIEAVDIGTPTTSYDLNSVTGTVNKQPVASVEKSPVVNPGIALNLGSNAIQPGASGEVKAHLGTIRRMLFKANTKESEPYGSFQFEPNYFDSSLVTGETDMTVTLHLMPGLQPNEPRYFPPKNWPGTAEPESGFDDSNRVFYRWHATNASSSAQYTFGAAFPARLVPASALLTETPSFNLDFGSLCPWIFCLGFVGFLIFTSYSAITGERKRRLQYLPPKVAVEGNGIKRGLTAVEAALLMEQPMDKILTMILFSVVKKGAATVISRDPMKLQITQPIPADLQTYEKDFVDAMAKERVVDQRAGLQEMMTNLVKGVSEKMRGFSRKDTVAYYQDIMNKAWQQVEQANTPEMKMKTFDDAMDWTMLDRRFNDRTRDVFGPRPVFVPMWWGRFDPGFGRGMAAGPSVAGPSVSTPTAGNRPPTGMSLPNLPGADFAGSMVAGMQSFAGSVVGDLTAFTGGVTAKTNPAPKVTTTSRGGGGGGGGRSCACACACAGCACACAGGGR